MPALPPPVSSLPPLQITTVLPDNLLAKASASPHRRVSLDLRNSPDDTSQRLSNALLPGAHIPIHRHLQMPVTILILKGRVNEFFYDADGAENVRFPMAPTSCNGLAYGVQVPIGQYHGVEVFEPAVIVEMTAGCYDFQTTEDYL